MIFKKVFKLMLIFSIVFNYSFSQKITFNELLLLHNKSLDYANDYLLNHGWEIYSSKQMSQEAPFQTVVWAHTINKYNKQLASGWITINFIEQNMTRVVYTYCKHCSKNGGSCGVCK